ncbi:hypothetical protein BTM25_11280 [Actinomadura rubteroloni]|uniref:Uncharacterized protein n=1 Tax=Actinomadura rubteroloni TaxID=1926885 RepID=A0A2P4UNW3_9ACTN|nr:hypothetical protein BTM25_11280 [Actinomadura rubteroloni]
MQTVARDLAAEPAEFGAQRAEVGVAEPDQLRVGARVAARAAPGVELAAVGEHQPDGLDVRRRHAPGHAVRSARVVADHSAERAAGMARRVGAEGQAVASGGGAQVVQDGAGPHHRRPGLRVHGPDGVEMPRDVHDDAGTDRVPGDGRAAAARRDGQPFVRGEREHCGQVTGVARFGHGGGEPAVEGRVGGVRGPGREVGPQDAGQRRREPGREIVHASRVGAGRPAGSRAPGVRNVPGPPVVRAAGGLSTRNRHRGPKTAGRAGAPAVPAPVTRSRTAKGPQQITPLRDGNLKNSTEDIP